MVSVREWALSGPCIQKIPMSLRAHKLRHVVQRSSCAGPAGTSMAPNAVFEVHEAACRLSRPSNKLLLLQAGTRSGSRFVTDSPLILVTRRSVEVPGGYRPLVLRTRG